MDRKDTIAVTGATMETRGAEVVVISRRFSILSMVGAMIVLAAILAPAGGARSGDAAPPSVPTIYVDYTMNCTFSIVDDSGKPITSIPPGTYQVDVSTPIMFKLAVPGGPGVDKIAPNDFTGCKGWVQFQLTGPNVNLFTTLDVGCDSSLVLPPVTFKPSATYTAQDLNQPSVTQTSFSTLATGTPVSSGKSAYTATSGKGTSQQELIGSLAKGKNPLKGTLNGKLTPAGKLTLTSNGKPVSSLKAGRYKFAITDEDPKAAFSLSGINVGLTKDLTGVSFVGKHSVTVTLTGGRWSYFTGTGKPTPFTVTG
jgi:hypothetical protein